MLSRPCKPKPPKKMETPLRIRVTILLANSFSKWFQFFFLPPLLHLFTRPPSFTQSHRSSVPFCLCSPLWRIIIHCCDRDASLERRLREVSRILRSVSNNERRTTGASLASRDSIVRGSTFFKPVNLPPTPAFLSFCLLSPCLPCKRYGQNNFFLVYSGFGR